MAREKYYTRKEWIAEGERRFGPDIENWQFVCPQCGRVNTGREFKEVGAKPNVIYCECIGRYKKDVGCDWAAYGLFDICKVEVDGQPVFDFAGVSTDGEKH